MQRLGCLALVICAACTSGTATGEATLTATGADLTVKAAACEPFADVDGAGTKVLGWNVLFYENEKGGDCLEGKVSAKVSIYSNQAPESGPQALLATGGIPVVPMNPPTATGNAAAYMGVEGVSMVMGQVTIDEFHLTPDAKHADRIRGTVSVGGYNANNEGVTITGTFTAPICAEQ